VPGSLEFEKYEGLGNDFIVIEAKEPLARDAVIELCDRHFGIGADGVLVVTPATTAGSRATMVVQNADGSRPEMCGNGLRCVALLLAERDGRGHAEYLVDTDAGVRRCEIARQGDQASVTIDMGRADARGELRASFDGDDRVFHLVSVGNPHAIALDFWPDVHRIDRFAPDVSQSIPGGANVEFVKPSGPNCFRVLVWERGVGRTLACGTGAAAVASALVRSGRAGIGEGIRLELPGGPLELWVNEASEVRMRGPATFVFRGALDPARLRQGAGSRGFSEVLAR